MKHGMILDLIRKSKEPAAMQYLVKEHFCTFWLAAVLNRTGRKFIATLMIKYSCEEKITHGV